MSVSLLPAQSLTQILHQNFAMIYQNTFNVDNIGSWVGSLTSHVGIFILIYSLDFSMMSSKEGYCEDGFLYTATF